MNKFKVILENGKEVTITAAGWNVSIGGNYVFFNDKNETVVVVHLPALIGNANSIK